MQYLIGMHPNQSQSGKNKISFFLSRARYIEICTLLFFFFTIKKIPWDMCLTMHKEIILDKSVWQPYTVGMEKKKQQT